MNYTSLYIHIPFCAKICDFCAFFVVARADAERRAAYLSRLERELDGIASLCDPLATLYIGGGTPTYLSNSETSKLMAILHRRFSFASAYEFTIEATPDTLTDEKVRILKDGGVSRFSIGVESFDEKTRSTIGRHGTARRVFEALEILNRHDLENVNLDLIYAIPGQTVGDWKSDLIQIGRLRPKHVSTYSLTVEPETPLARRGVSERDDNHVVTMWKLADAMLSESLDMTRYEVSNFAAPGYECRHNEWIWYGGKFVGAGPSACYFDGVSRWRNPTSLEQWLCGSPPDEDRIDAEKRAREILITGLRTLRGWDRDRFRSVTGFDYYELLAENLEDFNAGGLLDIDDDAVRCTPEGLLLADFIARRIV